MTIDLPFLKKKSPEPAYVESVIKTSVKNYNVYVMGKTETVLTSLVLFCAGAAAGYVFYGGLFKVDGLATTSTYISNIVIMSLVGIIAVAVFLPVRVRMQANNQKKKLREQFRSFLEAFVASLSAGKNVSQAIRDTSGDLALQYGEDSFICVELQEILDAERNNVHIEEMLKDLGTRSGVGDIADFGEVFEICYRQGANLKSVARKTYNIINDKMSIEDEIETKLTSNKTQFYIMMFTPVVVVGMLRFTNETFANNFATPSGILAVTVGLVCIGVAFLLGKKITTF